MGIVLIAIWLPTILVWVGGYGAVCATVGVLAFTRAKKGAPFVLVASLLIALPIAYLLLAHHAHSYGEEIVAVFFSGSFFSHFGITTHC